MHALPSCSYLFLHLLLPKIAILNEIDGAGDMITTCKKLEDKLVSK